MKFETKIAGASWGGLSFTAVDGVIEIPEEHVGHFRDLIDCGMLVPIPDPAPDAETRSVKSKKA